MLNGCIIKKQFWISDYFGQQWDYIKEELLSMSIHDIDADHIFVSSTLQPLSRGHKVVNFEHRLRKKDGSIITVINNSIPITDATGNFVGMQSTRINITQRKQAEQELRKNQSLLRTLIDALPDLIWLKNPDGVYMACNTRFERFLGKKEKEIIGKNDYVFMAKDQAELFRFQDRMVIERDNPNTFEEEITFADDGHCEVLETIKRPIYTEDDDLIGVLGIGYDITDRKLKDKMQAAKLRLIDFSGTHSAKELLQKFLDEAVSLTGSSIGFFHFVEDDQQTLTFQTWSTNTLVRICNTKGEKNSDIIDISNFWVDGTNHSQ